MSTLPNNVLRQLLERLLHYYRFLQPCMLLLEAHLMLLDLDYADDAASLCFCIAHIAAACLRKGMCNCMSSQTELLFVCSRTSTLT